MRMNNFPTSVSKATFCVPALIGYIFSNTNARKTKLTLDLTKPGANVSLMLYELMTEQIDHSYDSGLYAELIRHRIFKNNPARPEGWSLVQYDTFNSKASMKILAATQATFLLMNVDMRSMVNCKAVYGLPWKKQTAG